jgi:hypothetical protein
VLLKANRESLLDKGPLTSVDFRTFEHDRRVSFCRIALERQGKSLRWHSDRYLKHKSGYPLLSGRHYSMKRRLVPDGLFVSSREELVALEVEHTHKRRERYDEKRRYYRALIEHSKIEAKMYGEEICLHRVMFIASTDRVGKDLQEFFGEVSGFSVMS